MESNGLKMIGALRSQNTSNTSSRKDYEKADANMPVYDEGDDAIASQNKSMSHLGHEEGQKMVDTPSRESPELKTIGALCSQNI